MNGHRTNPGRDPGAERDPIASALAFLAHGPTDTPRVSDAHGPAWTRAVAEEARRLQEAGETLLQAFTLRAPLPPPALAVVRRALEAGTWRYTLDLDPGTGRPRVVGRPSEPTQPLAVLSDFARGLTLVLATVDAERLRRCAAPDCRTWFHDTSRNGRRRWCSMATCGNRAKAARYRARHAPAATAAQAPPE